MRFSSKHQATLIIFFSLFVITVGHQNCTKVSVQDMNQASEELQILECTEGPCAEPPVHQPPPEPEQPNPNPLPQPSPNPKEPPPIAEFSCQKIVPLALSSTLQVPARDAEGTCYSVRLMDVVLNSASGLSKEQDAEIKARDHGKDSSIILDEAHPYILGMETLDIVLADRRFVKLSGKSDQLSPIRVDNFIVSGIFPKQMAESASLDLYYRAYGTADSALSGKNHILFREKPVQLKSFGASGTSSVQALDITSDIQPNVVHTLDLRALDCGGVRELSEIYILFQ